MSQHYFNLYCWKADKTLKFINLIEVFQGNSNDQLKRYNVNNNIPT